MLPPLGCFQVEAGPATDHLLLVADIVGDDLLEAHLQGLAPGNGHHVHPEGGLQIAIFI